MPSFGAADPLALQVCSVSAEARDVLMIGLEAEDGRKLPSSTAGGHLEIRLANGLIRHYSLINDCRDTTRYLIAVGRAETSRGGSDFIHSRLREGSRVELLAVRNNFALDEDARRYRFIAGGIGITPIMAMIRESRRQEKPWSLVYAVRSRQRAAFYEDLGRFPDNVRIHADDEAGTVLDVKAALHNMSEDEHVYCCGPSPLMEAVAAATASLPAGRVHFEWFNAPVQDAAMPAGGEAFEVTLRRSGITLTVAADQSILQAIEGAGIAHPFSCREGACGTCATKVLEGAVNHRDFVLSEEERKSGDTMMVCVSRAAGGHLVLDL